VIVVGAGNIFSGMAAHRHKFRSGERRMLRRNICAGK
jgi:hypothetical protein